jgi:deoxyribonuclease-4
VVQAQASRKIISVYPLISDRNEPEAAVQPRRIGIHTSIAGGVVQALETARWLRCTTMQIFSASPRMWTDGRQVIDPAKAAEFRERRREWGVTPLVIHANYLINLAAPEGNNRTKSIRGFRAELDRAIGLGAEYLVVHPGSRGENTIDAAIRQIAESLRISADGLDLGTLRILIEITAGQGSAVGSRLEELRGILEAGSEMDLGVCLDTAHVFAAGYDVRNEKGLENAIDEIDRVIGLERVPVVHVNDSKAVFGSRVDRHEHLGRGHMGLEVLRRIVNHPRLAGRAFILETPIDRAGDDWRNVRTLWRLAGVEWSRLAGSGRARLMRRTVKRSAVNRRG